MPHHFLPRRNGGAIESLQISMTFQGIRILAFAYATPGVNEISQVPLKGRLNVHGAYDGARFGQCLSVMHLHDVAFSSAERDQHLELRPLSLLNTQPMVPPVNASPAPSRVPAHYTGPEAVGWTLLRGGLPPPILCQVCLAHAACGRLLPLKSCRISRIERPLMGKAEVEISIIEQVQPNDRYEDRPGLGGHIKKYAIMRKEVSHDEEEIPTLPSRVRASLIG